MIKQTIQPSDEKMWSDVESNTQVVSDDDALMKSTGKVGELKRYDYPVRFGRSQLTNFRVYNFWTRESTLRPLGR